MKITDQPPPSPAKKFTKEDMKTKVFHHEYGTQGGRKGTMGHLAIVEQIGDGYCKVAQLGPRGVSLPLLTLWSGCLFPDREMDQEERDAIKQVGEIADVMAVKPKAKGETHGN